MTAIIGFINPEDKSEWICSDSMIASPGSGDLRNLGAEKVIFSGNVSYCIAGALSANTTMVSLIHNKKIPKLRKSDDPYVWACAKLIPAIEEQMKDKDFEMIVIANGKMFIIDHDMSVCIVADDLGCVGAGGVYAEMALRGSSYRSDDKGIIKLLTDSFRIAQKRNILITTPYKIYKDRELICTVYK